MDIWEQVSDQLDQYLTGDDDLALSMIPSLFGISVKATYLGFRAMGLTPAQALQTLNLPPEYIDYWKDSDPDFLSFEFRNLIRIQKESSGEIIKLGFYKNTAAMIAKDSVVITKALVDIESLSKREYEVYLKARGHYTTAELRNLEQALNPHQQDHNLTIQLNWGGNVQELIDVTPLQLTEGGSDYDTAQERIPLEDPAQNSSMLPLSEGS